MDRSSQNTTVHDLNQDPERREVNFAQMKRLGKHWFM